MKYKLIVLISLISITATWAINNTDRIIKSDDEIRMQPANKVAVEGNIHAEAEGELRLEDAAGGEYMGLKAPTAVTSSTTCILPDGPGTAGQVLSDSDGACTLDWVNATSFDFTASTDNAIIRADTVGANEIQESSILIDDSDNITGITSASATDYLMAGFLEADHIATPATPAAGKARLYVKSDNKLYLKDPSGTETEVGGADQSDPLTVTTISSATYTITTDDDVIKCDASSNDVDLTVYSPTSNSGKRIKVIKIDSTSNHCSIGNAAAETIDGQTQVYMWGQYKSYEIITDGTDWFNIGYNKKQVCIVSDRKGSGAAGGTSTSNTTHTRDLNNTHGDCEFMSLSSNQIVIDNAGVYEFDGSCPAYKANQHQLHLYNITGAALLWEGTAEYADNPNVVNNRSHLKYTHRITATNTYEIRHFIDNGQATDGLGRNVHNVGTNPASVNTFCLFKITRIPE